MTNTWDFTGRGADLATMVDRLASITAYSDKLMQITQLKGVVIVGGTCAGKSTLVSVLRDSVMRSQGLIDVPVRYVTRQARAGDDPAETRHATAAEFQAFRSEGRFGLSWDRKMGDNRVERYGLAIPKEGALPVYLGGNGLYDNPDSVSPRNALQHCILIGVDAPDKVRRERLFIRSPDLVANCPDEVAMRLRLGTENMMPHIHIVIKNYGKCESIALMDFERVVSSIVELIGAKDGSFGY
jgi:ribose 1,5-bisphosphokinase PhnN